MTTAKTFLYRIVCGFFLGLSAFAPGFSGSVMAIAMGIYYDLIKIVSNPLQNTKQSLRYLLPMAIGVLISVPIFVFAIRFLFQRFERATLLLFVGLIAGNLPVIGHQLKDHPWQKRNLLGGLLSFGTALFFGLLAVEAGQIAGGAGVAVQLPVVVLSGFLAGAVALVPGISISAILIVFGVYGQLLLMAETFLQGRLTYLPHLAGIAVAALLGLLLTSRGIRRLFSQFPGLANACVFGFMAGTLIGIFAESLHVTDAYFNWWMGAAVVLAGFGVATAFVFLGKAMNRSGL